MRLPEKTYQHLQSRWNNLSVQPGSVIWRFAHSFEPSCWKEVDQLESNVNQQACEESPKEVNVFNLKPKKMEGVIWAMTTVQKIIIYLLNPFWLKNKKKKRNRPKFLILIKLWTSFPVQQWNFTHWWSSRAGRTDLNDTGVHWSCSGTIKFVITYTNAKYHFHPFYFLIIYSWEETQKFSVVRRDCRSCLPLSHSFPFCLFTHFHKFYFHNLFQKRNNLFSFGKRLKVQVK